VRVDALDLEAWLATALGGVASQPATAPPASPSTPPIVQAGATVLRQRAREVAPSLMGSSAFARLVEVMVEAMRAAPGVGLAAPQIGVPLRVFVAEDDAQRMARLSAQARESRQRAALPLTVWINPEVTPTSADEVTFYEGCLSVRGYGALVSRAASVSVAGLDANGRATSMHFAGWAARIMQHEMDHLNGTLYVDRMIPRSFAGEDDLARLSSLPVSDVLDDLVRLQKE